MARWSAGSPYPAAGLRRVTALGAERDLTRENPASRGKPDIPTGKPRFVIRHWSFVIPRFLDRQTPTELICAPGAGPESAVGGGEL